MITLDFETYPIGPRPDHFPPKPVGLAVRWEDGTTFYGTTWDAMEAILYQAEDKQANGCPILFHHAKFDCHVAAKWFGIRFQDRWDLVEDTMIMAFLVDPYGKGGLKKLAEIWLGMDPNERDVVAEWIVANKDKMPDIPWMLTPKGNPKRPTKATAGAWIAWAPPELVGPYAIGDVERTFRLAQVFRPILEQCGLMSSYLREMRVHPIFMKNEERGVNVDLGGLAEDIPMYQMAFDYAETWLRWRLGADGLNFDADDDVSAILHERGIVTEWKKTKTGKRAMGKKELHPDQFHDKQVASVLGYRNRMKTCLKMFMEPWYEQASARPDGRLSTNWNQIQGDGGGTKTGRPSTNNPNMLNMSKKFEGLPDGYEHPEFLGVPRLPLVRKYILADEGEVILKRDFSGQELHIFGEFSCGELRAQFRANPKFDPHNFVGSKIAELMGQDPGRGKVKVLNFQGMYGGGVPAAAAEMRISLDEAKKFKQFHDAALPDRKILSDTLAHIVRTGRSIRTYGGRLYGRPPFITRDNGTLSPADYRLINYLIQGSAADITKEAMIRLHDHPDFDSYWMFQVYDEMNISAPWDKAVEQMLVLQEAMESIPLSTSLPTDGEYGVNWGEMTKIKSIEELRDATIPF